MKEFSAAEICKIMLTARKSNVAKLEIGRLKIEFSVLDQAAQDQWQAFGVENSDNNDHTSTESNNPPRFSEADTVLGDLLLTDPAAYEQLIQKDILDEVQINN